MLIIVEQLSDLVSATDARRLSFRHELFLGSFQIISLVPELVYVCLFDATAQLPHVLDREVGVFKLELFLDVVVSNPHRRSSWLVSWPSSVFAIPSETLTIHVPYVCAIHSTSIRNTESTIID